MRFCGVQWDIYATHRCPDKPAMQYSQGIEIRTSARCAISASVM
jgi:hypothetical protein